MMPIRQIKNGRRNVSNRLINTSKYGQNKRFCPRKTGFLKYLADFVAFFSGFNNIIQNRKTSGKYELRNV